MIVCRVESANALAKVIGVSIIKTPNQRPIKQQAGDPQLGPRPFLLLPA